MLTSRGYGRSLKVGAALFEERGDAFLGVVSGSRPRHHVDRVRVRVGLAELGLGIEAALARRLRRHASTGCPAQQVVHGLVELVVGNGVVDEPPRGSGCRIDGIAGEGHLHRPLAADVAGNRHQRRVTEQPAFPTGDRERRTLGGDRQVARSHELATGGGRQRMHSGHDRLRDRLDRVHHLGAHIEQMGDVLEVGTRHVGKVVAGREHRTVGGQDRAG